MYLGLDSPLGGKATGGSTLLGMRGNFSQDWTVTPFSGARGYAESHGLRLPFGPCWWSYLPQPVLPMGLILAAGTLVRDHWLPSPFAVHGTQQELTVWN